MQKIRCSHCRKLWEQDLMLSEELAKSTGVNSPRIASIDDKRDEIAELLATAVSSGRADVRSALMRDPEYLALMRALEKDPQVRAVLMESLGAAERTAGGPQEEELQEPVGDYDHQAFQEAKERARRQQLGREAIAKGDAQQVVAAAQRLANKYADNRARAGLAPVTDHAVQKSATDKSPVNLRDLGRPRRMHPGEVLR
jgi:uncharacterized protein YoaH (UPF0181 family)